VLLNPAGRRMLELPAPEDCPPSALARLDLRRLDGAPVRVGEIVEEVRAGRRIRDDQLVLLDADGERRHLVLDGSGVPGTDGAMQWVMLLLRDVTTARKLEQVRALCVAHLPRSAQPADGGAAERAAVETV
jgi:PAS domain-containing protein